MRLPRLAPALGALGLLLALGALFAAPATAKEVRPAPQAFGSLNQPSFTEPRGLAVDRSSGDVYVIDGRREVQTITVSATGGSFRLKFGGVATGDLQFNASKAAVESALTAAVETALGAPCGGSCASVGGGPGDGSGSTPYVVRFTGTLFNAAVEQIGCENGSSPLSGGSGCAVTTTIDGVDGSISRYHADGSPSNFSSLSGNVIDGKGAEDETPQQGLGFGSSSGSQVVVDDSGGDNDGDIYVTQPISKTVDVFAPSGKYLGQLTKYKEGDAAAGPLKPFDQTCGVAVDSSGNVYVGELTPGSRIHKYDPAGNPVLDGDNIANFSILASEFGICSMAAGAGPTAGFIFANRPSGGELFKLDATTGDVKYKFINSGNQFATVDATSGRVFAPMGREVLEYDASGASSATLLDTIPAGSTVTGIAVDGTTGPGGTVYLARSGASQLDVYGPLVIVPDVLTLPASEVKGTTATLNGTIAAAGVSGATCHFQYLAEATYQANIAQATGEGKADVEIAEAAFTGASSVPCDPAGPFSGSSVNAVSGKVTGLSGGSKYEFRIIGENADGASPGSAESLETVGPPLLKAGLASEITATAAKISGEVNPRTLATSFAVEYVSEAQFEVDEYAAASTVPVPAQNVGSASGFVAVSQQLSGLAPATTYHFRLSAGNEEGPTLGVDQEFTTFAPATGLPDNRAYEMVSPPLKLGEVFPPESTRRFGLGGTCYYCVPGYDKQKMPMQASPDGSAVAYLGGPFSAGLASGSNQYVAQREMSGWKTTPLSPALGRENTEQGFKSFSADLSRGVLYQIEPALTLDAPVDFANLYAWQTGGGLTPLITEAPSSRSPGLGPNGFALTYAGANAGTGSSPAFSHVIFQANDALTEEAPGIAPAAPAVGVSETDLYEWMDGELHLVNVLPGNVAAAANAVIGSGQLLSPTGHIASENFNFDHAISDDGSRIFWSKQPSGQVYVREGASTTVKIPDPGKFLTATPDGGKVLLDDGVVYDLEDETQTDLTEGQGGFEGLLGAAEDLSRVYFVDTEVLPGAGENERHESAQSGAFNLYLWEEGEIPHEGTTAFVATLLAEDSNFNDLGAWHAAPSDRLAQVSADGRFLAFQSTASLTGYDNTPAAAQGCLGSGAAQCFEVFEYDATAASLACASCNPSGQRPLGGSNLSQINAFRGNLPQPHNLPPAGDGRLFFESQDTLSPADTNGHIQDVYQWVPDGAGGCELLRGCVSLISSGHDPNDSHFVNATPSGNDVFFDTREALVPFDRDDFVDLYDARVGGGIDETEIPPCLGEVCRGARTLTPSDSTAGSSTFSGPANQKSCKKGFVKKRGKCVRKPKHHKKHPKRPAKHHKGGSK